MSGRTALVTGASSGIGREVARLLVARGFTVLGTSRDPDTVADPLPGVRYLALDLTDRASIDDCAKAAGAVDVLVNNAGESQMGPLEDLPQDAIDRLFQVNVFGQIQLTRALLPGMRAAGYGRVVMVGSMLASFPVAFRSSYVATKAALAGFTTAARHELSPFGVWLTTVEPGTIATGIAERRSRYLADGSAFAQRYAAMDAAQARGEESGISAEKVARMIVRAIDAERPKQLYAVGNNAPFAFTLRRLLPRAVMERVIHRRYDLR